MPTSPSYALEAGGAVVGLIGDEEVSFLRFSVYDRGLVAHSAATIPWESGMSLGEPLERILGWTPAEPVLLGMETPDLVGETVTLSTAVLPTTRRVDHRTLQLRALQDARQVVRERARRYFDCTLECVEILAESFIPLANAEDPNAVTILAALRSPEERRGLVPVPPPDVPVATLVFLPLVAGTLVHEQSPAVGVITIERKTLTYTVWVDRRIQHLRSLPLGANVLVDALARALACRPPAAEELLVRMDGGDLSPHVVRLVARVLRRLLPLFSGAWSALAEDLPPTARPVTVYVGGLFATLVARTFGRPQLLSRCAAVTQSAQLLCRPGLTGCDPRHALLATALLRGLQETVLPSRFGASVPRYVRPRHDGGRAPVAVTL